MPKRKNRTRNRTLDFMAYLGLRIFEMFVHMFPMRTNYRTARWAAELLWRISRRHRERAIAHLRLSFPDWDENKIHRTARHSMHNMFYLGLEFLFTPRLITPGRWRKHIRLVNMEENLRLLLEHQTGLIYLTGHFGNWEVIGYTVAELGFPSNAVARRMDNPYLDKYVIGTRENKGMRILDKRGATEEAPQLLEQKSCVSFIADQDAGRKGLFVDFFGRKASTYKSIGLLAMQHNVPVIVGYGMRLKDVFNFEIGIEDIIYPEDWADQEDPLYYITQRYTTAIENSIRRAPEQYLWIHRRWKHRPKGEETPPDGIA